MPTKIDGLGLLNAVAPENEKYLISQQGSAKLIWDMTGGEALSNAYHLRTLKEERRDFPIFLPVTPFFPERP